MLRVSYKVEAQSIHDSMHIPKIEFISLMYATSIVYIETEMLCG